MCYYQSLCFSIRATNINVVPRLYIVIPPNVDIDLSVTTVDKENVYCDMSGICIELD